ncbi:MAG: hypothetical protein KAT62_03880 [Desulfuromonadales bacterium]|nr:hypothetical protein [Desulfuromonadales bacterium]
MTCVANVTKGRQLVFLIRDALDTVWEIAGGIKVRGYQFDNPVEDTTSSSTTGEFEESEWVGFSKASLTVSGHADNRTGVADPATGLNIVGSERLLEVATTGNRCAKFKMLNLDSNGFIEGYFNVTGFGKSGDAKGVLTFDASLESKSDVTVSGAV